MEKLELKHIAGYLPYGLKIMVHDDFVMKMTEQRLNWEENEDLDKISIHGVLEDFHCKPILRNLSDLTKEIEVNGEKFVPIEVLGNINSFSKIITFENPDFLYKRWIYYSEYGSEKEREEEFICDNHIEMYQKLYEWHFDLHSLIEKNLAIDINALNL